MRLLLAGAAILAGHLALAPGAGAQLAPTPPPDDLNRFAPRDLGGGLEVGALTSVALIVPAFGGQVSVPVARRIQFEVSGELSPWLLEDADDFWFSSQAQLRFPMRDRPRVRQSLVAGVTSFTVFDRWSEGGRRSRWEWEAFVRPHAGISWQWQRTRHLDVRLDVQGVIVGTTAPFVVPRVAFSTVWRRQGGRL